MKEIRAEVVIASTPQRVWQVFSDFAAYPIWNVFLVRVTGEAKRGEELEIRVQLPGTKATPYRAAVLKADAEKELRWKWKGFLKGEHVFTLEPMGDNMTRFTQKVEFGFLSGALADKDLTAKTEEMFGHMHRALKARCEESAD
ncbi:MAG: SRPBCC domain-containing protein [Nitrospinae bacterium]|nr:SRPBCC domain-containing protein [Nitrospinota bacterium]